MLAVVIVIIIIILIGLIGGFVLYWAIEDDPFEFEWDDNNDDDQWTIDDQDQKDVK